MRMSHLFTPARRLVVPLAAIALVLSACGRSAPPLSLDSTDASGLASLTRGAGVNAGYGGSFYPLELGNRWRYEHALTIYAVPEGGPPGPAFGFNREEERSLVCVEQSGDRSYVVEENGPPVTPAWWVRYRQDAAGLYEGDVSVAEPPPCNVAGRVLDDGAQRTNSYDEVWAAFAATRPEPAQQGTYRAAFEKLRTRAAMLGRMVGAGSDVSSSVGVESGEITRLQYPLRPGAHWVIRAEPRFESTVEGADALDLAVGHLPAWRIRVDSEFVGADDHVHVWYGRSGFLKSVVHIEEAGTDTEGNIVRMILDERWELIDLSLNGQGGATP